MNVEFLIVYQIGATFGSVAFVTSESDDQSNTNGDTNDHAADESHSRRGN